MKIEVAEALKGIFLLLFAFIIPIFIFWALWIFLLPYTFWERAVWVILSLFISLFFEVVYFLILMVIE